MKTLTFLQVGPLSSLAGVISSLAIILTFCHWKQLKKPYLALIKLLLIAACLFGMSTLPWQQNFVGLIGGIFFGMGLTFALVPFVNITKYNRKSKVRRKVMKLPFSCFEAGKLPLALNFLK